MEKGWKQVFLTDKEYRAEIARELLENNGVNAVVLNQHDSTYLVFGDIEVYVKDEDEAIALEILKELKD